MTRSFGDTVAHSVGCNAEPEMGEYSFSKDDKVVVIASDGVWEFMSNEKVSEIVIPYYESNQPEAAANAIVKAAHQRWREEEEVVDDITAVVVFLEPMMAYGQLNDEKKYVDGVRIRKSRLLLIAY